MTGLAGKVDVVNPLVSRDWNNTLLGCEKGTIFHSANWAQLLAEAYGYLPKYLTLSEHGSFRGCLPVMEVDSLLTGRRGVALSFSDYCGAVVQQPSEFKLLFDSILEVGRTSGWRYLEFRGEEFLNSEPPAKVYAHHMLELTKDEEQMRSHLRESTARNIKKAAKEGVVVTI